MIDHKGCLFVDSFWTSQGSMEAVDVRKERKILNSMATSQLIILNRYDNICYRICFLLLSWGGFSRLESSCCCERLRVSCCERICVSCYSLLFKLFTYWVFFSRFRMVLAFSSFALIMTASSSWQFPSVSAVCLICSTDFALLVRFSSKFCAA